ncbi:unnamed protein product [Rotaria sp. Silwood1]|nr:unnamed protein product [Rotaria sp. Silwood1]
MSTFGLTKLQPIIQSMIDTSISLHFIFNIIERKSEINASENEGKIEVPLNTSRDITFDNVEFVYKSRETPNFNLVIPSGKITAIIGESGCGKSTVFKLIQRVYDPTKGRTLFGNDDVKTLNLKTYRSNIALVDQEPQLFLDTIEENIKFGNPNATDKDMEEACRIAIAYDFIQKLPEKFKSKEPLSGGQKQRVAVARALVSKAKILLLDEATSALDNQNEQEMIRALNNIKITMGLTIVVIAHRLSTVQQADNIVCMKHGQGIVEQGTHAELMAHDGLYRHFYMTQQNPIAPALTKEEKSTIIPTDTNENNNERTEQSTDVQQISITNNNSKLAMFLIEILKLNRSEWFYLCLGCIASLIYGAITPAFALIFSELYALFVEQDYQKQEVQARNYAIIIFFIGVLGGICQMSFTSSFSKSGEELTSKIRLMSFKAILKQEIAWFDQKENNSFTLINNLYTDSNALKSLNGMNIGIFFNAIGTIVTALVIAIRIHWQLTLIILCFAPVIILMSIFLQGQQFSTNIGNKNKVKLKTTSHAQEGNKCISQAIDNFRTVQSFSKEDVFINKCEQEFNQEFRESIYKILMIAFGNAIANSIMFFIHAAAFSYGSHLVKQKQISFVDVFRIFSVVTFAATSIGRTVALVPSFSKAKKAASKILKLNKQKSRIDPESCDGLILVRL